MLYIEYGSKVLYQDLFLVAIYEENIHIHQKLQMGDDHSAQQTV